MKQFSITADKKTINQFHKKMNRLKMFAADEFKKGIQNTGANAVKIAQRRVPVKTGDLKRSIHLGQEMSGKYVTSVYVAAEMDYAGRVEFGTSRQKPQPYFFNSIRDAMRFGLKNLQIKINKITKS